MAAWMRARISAGGGIFFPDRKEANSRRTSATTAGLGRSSGPRFCKTFSTAGRARKDMVYPRTRIWGLRERTIRPITAADRVWARWRIAVTARWCLGATHRSKPPLVWASAQRIFLRAGDVLPSGEFAHGFQIVAGAARNAIPSDQVEDLRRDDRQHRGIDFRSHPAGPAE